MGPFRVVRARSGPPPPGPVLSLLTPSSCLPCFGYAPTVCTGACYGWLSVGPLSVSECVYGTVCVSMGPLVSVGRSWRGVGGCVCGVVCVFYRRLSCLDFRCCRRRALRAVECPRGLGVVAGAAEVHCMAVSLAPHE